MTNIQRERTRLRELLSLACDEQLAPDHRRELEQLVADNRDHLLGEYFDFLSIDALLRDAGTLRRLRQQFADPPPVAGRDAPMLEKTLRTKSASPTKLRDTADRSQVTLPRRHAATFPRWRNTPAATRRCLRFTATAATLLIAFGLWRSGAFFPHGSVIDVELARFRNAEQCDVGDAVSGQWLELETGVVQLLFRQGIHATLHGPARMRTTSGISCELAYGELSAYAPEETVGFVVVGPGFAATDLGTSFRILCPPEAPSTLRVTEGAVQLDHDHSGESITVTAGDAVQFDVQQGPRFEPRPESALSCTGDAEFIVVHPRSVDGRRFRDDRRIGVFLERTGVRLLQRQAVDFVDAGVHKRFAVGRTMDAGSTVDVYLLHFAPQSRRKRAVGTVRFPSPIAGVIAATSQLDATSATLGSSSALRCQNPERGLEAAGDPNSDIVAISDDRRTLTLECQTESIDQIRVLVESEPSSRE